MSQESEIKVNNYHLDHVINKVVFNGDTITSEKYSTGRHLSFYISENMVGYCSESLGWHILNSFRILWIKDTLKFYNDNAFYTYFQTDELNDSIDVDKLVISKWRRDKEVGIDSLKSIYSFLIIRKDDNNIVLEPIDPIYKFTMLDTTSIYFNRKKFKQEFHFSK
ncbi:MAG: hypothetical protein ACE364_07945 [Chlorobiota bacterium]